MSDRPIRVGDLVMFVHSCCDGFRDGVLVFTVAAIKPDRAGTYCSSCNKTLPHERHAADAAHYGGSPLSWLKRIPPLEELESQRTEESTRDPVNNFERHFKVKS